MPVLTEVRKLKIPAKKNSAPTEFKGHPTQHGGSTDCNDIFSDNKEDLSIDNLILFDHSSKEINSVFVKMSAVLSFVTTP
jgi:hypothetical protein